MSIFRRSPKPAPPAPRPSVAAEHFKATLQCWPSGVTVVTVAQDGLWHGLTVSSFTSVSLDPPLVSVCLDGASQAVPFVEATGRFAVSVLGEGQVEVSDAFARRGREPSPDFTDVPTALTLDGLPVLADAVAWLQCRLHQRVDAGDHAILIGEVEQTASTGGAPLLYFARAYGGVRGLG